MTRGQHQTGGRNEPPSGAQWVHLGVLRARQRKGRLSVADQLCALYHPNTSRMLLSLVLLQLPRRSLIIIRRRKSRLGEATQTFAQLVTEL